MSEPVDPQRTVYIETVGCQMNLLDSELIVGGLRDSGYAITGSPAGADVILFNTCSVRQHAEDKIYSALGRLKHQKKQQPDLVIGVVGCMAQKDQERIFQRAPHVDLICSPGQLATIPSLVDETFLERRHRSALGLDRNQGARLDILDSFESFDPQRNSELRPSSFQAYVRLMMGCDKFCTYCIVPTVRGPEQGRPPSAIAAEVDRLVGDGCKEITLLGQTVNSYQFEEGGRRVRLADILYRIHDAPGLARIKFITNYPKDMTDDLLGAVRDLPKVSPYLHVPAQSGCDEVLARMKRGYTVADYRAMMHRIRAALPGAAVSSDFIVGFPGETAESFERSAQLVRDCRFKNSFIFKYSPRQGTKAHANLADDVPEEEKRRRNHELLAIQARISLEDNRDWIGRTVEILVEGPSKTSRQRSTDSAPIVQMSGRTPEDRIVVFEGHPRQQGQFLPIRITAATPHTLIGAVVTREAVAHW